MKSAIKEYILTKATELDGMVLRCKDGRKIVVDRFLDETGYAVTVFSTSGYAYDRDYNKDLPVMRFDSQKKLESEEAVAEYISTLF